MSFVVWSMLKVVSGIRISEEEELEGVDEKEFGMHYYPEFTNLPVRYESCSSTI